MTRVEHRTAAFLAEVERILRQIIFAGGALRSGPVMLNDETSSILFASVYEARKESPWLNVFSN